MSDNTVVCGDCQMHGRWERTWPAPLAARVKAECPACTKARHDAEEAERQQQRIDSAEANRLEAAVQGIGLSARFKRCTLANFVASTADQRRVLAACAEFVNSFDPSSGRNLLLVGGVGTGKTHLASAIARAVVEAPGQHHRAHVSTAAEYLRRVYATWRPQSAISEQDVIEHFGTADLMVLDEIGVGATSEKQRDQVFALVDRRYQCQRPTVYVSNLNLRDLELSLGPRLFDRMRDGAAVLACTWASHRAFGRSVA